VLRDPAKQDAYRHLVSQTLQASDYKPDDFTKFCEYAGVPAAAHHHVRSAYDETQTLQAFFAALRQQYPQDSALPFCTLAGSWVRSIVDTALRGLHREEWIIQATVFFADEESQPPLRVHEVGASWCCGWNESWGEVQLHRDAMHMPAEDV
jgi:hypothetical protein